MLQRFIPFLAAVLIFGLFEVLYLYPKFIFLGYFLLLIALTSAIVIISGKGLKISFNVIYFLIAPLIFFFSTYSFVLFLEQNILRHIFAVIASLACSFYLYQIFLHIWRPQNYASSSLENISGYLNILSLFFFASTILGFKIFFQIPILSLSPLLYLFFFIFFLQIIWTDKFSFKEARLFIFLNALIALEFILALSFLPLGFLSLGAIFTALSYLLIEFSRGHLLKTFNQKFIFKRLGFAIFLFLAVLLTARWTI